MEDCEGGSNEKGCVLMAKKPIRVLQIMGIVESGGVEAVIMNYYKHIDKSKIQFDFVMHKGSNPDYITKAKAMGAKVFEVTPYTKNILLFIYEIYKICKENNYLIIHSNMNSLSGFSLFAAYLAGVPFRILHNHTTDNKNEGVRTLFKRALRPFSRLFANMYFACSKKAAVWMYGKKALEFGKVTIINNAIDLKQFAFAKNRRQIVCKQLGLENSFVIGHVGRFVQTKNHSFLIDIFAEVRKNDSIAKLLLVGDGPLRKRIEDKVMNLGLMDNVIFTGVRSDVADLYNAMDVFVLPSFYEGLPVVGVEVQANGLPFICSSNVTKEIAITDKIRFLGLDKSAQSWKDAIYKYGTQVRDKADTNIDIINSGFDIIVEASKLEKLYFEVLSNA